MKIDFLEKVKKRQFLALIWGLNIKKQLFWLLFCEKITYLTIKTPQTMKFNAKEITETLISGQIRVTFNLN